jgi:hypothetical protein
MRAPGRRAHEPSHHYPTLSLNSRQTRTFRDRPDAVCIRHHNGAPWLILSGMRSKFRVVCQQSGRRRVTRTPDARAREAALAGLVMAPGSVCSYCDRIDHNEGTDPAVLLAAGETLRSVAISVTEASAGKVRKLYAARLEQLEARNVLSQHDGPSWPDQIRQAKTWRDVQMAQVRHDATFHPDVFGLSKLEQVKHFAFHLGKLVGHMHAGCRDEVSWNTFFEGRFIDLLIFGVKLATVANHRLPAEPSDDLR